MAAENQCNCYPLHIQFYKAEDKICDQKFNTLIHATFITFLGVIVILKYL